ncbi:transcriptional regulator [Flavobacterium silvisoli]|uniref:Transcriptional regulator n=1 Tax=Flavobacterium silvisoli TaxID=2529433 RepID=A0A4Q9YT85_9FLAO|nr:GyrI-like domain-containing protein [Flavobacterium silvisoli]TBX66639.1 transcriptional regulator [Flavobacterium silvisoli]
MRILKYIFLLIVLAFIGVTVYVATQNGNFEITKSSIVKARKSSVFDYVNDYKNWESFGSYMTKENNIQFDYPAKTVGSGASFSWTNGSDNGTVKTVFVKENDSLSQKVSCNGSSANISWTFKDTVGGTKVTLYGKGKLDIFTKITTFFKGGISNLLTDTFEKSLRNLDKTLDYEMKTYSIKVNGIVQRNSGFCLQQKISCKIKSLPKNIKIVMSGMVHFFKKNKLVMAGKPYIQYDRYDAANDFVTFSVCIPTREQIFVTPESDVSSAEIIPFTCLKTTLVGDYSHTQEAWSKAKKYIKDNGLTENLAGKYTEVYVKTIDDIKQPSKWITEIYIPVFPKAESAIPATIPVTPVVKSTEPTTETP